MTEIFLFELKREDGKMYSREAEDGEWQECAPRTSPTSAQGLAIREKVAKAVGHAMDKAYLTGHEGRVEISAAELKAD
jgi:hypothetical protein